jgi:tetratricopeptide (TPR) repeat protein
MRLRTLALIWVVSNLLIAACKQNSTHELMPVTTNSELAREYYETAITALDQVRLSLAWENLQMALKEDPDFFMANFWMYFISSKDSKGIGEKVLQSDAPLNEAESNIKTAFKYLLDGQDEKVVEYLQKAIDLYPYDPQVHKILYTLQLQFMKDVDGAIASIEESIKWCPDFPLAYNMLGYALMEQEKYGQAEKAFDQYIRKEPELANPYDSKGDYFMTMKQYEAAYKSYMKAYELDSSFTVSQKKAEKARQMLEKSET